MAVSYTHLLVQHEGNQEILSAFRHGFPEKEMGEGADEVAAPRHQQGEESGDHHAAFYLFLIPDTDVYKRQPEYREIAESQLQKEELA